MSRILVLTLVFLAMPLGANELEERDAERQRAASLFLAGNYEKLESLAEWYRQSDERTSAGMSKLRLLYEGIALAMPEEAEDNEAWDRNISAVQNWVDKHPTSPTPYLAKAHIYIHRGWTYRGESRASANGTWAEFRYKQEAKKTRDWLQDNRKYAASDPEYYSVLLFAYRAITDSKPEVLALLYEGITRFPNHDQIYIRGAGYLSPKWFGSLEELSWFAENAVVRTKDARGHEMFARIYWAAGRGSDRQLYLSKGKFDRKKLMQGMRDLVERFPDQWNINHMASFACVLNDVALARELTDLIEPPIELDAWYIEENYTRCLWWIDKNTQDR